MSEEINQLFQPEERQKLQPGEIKPFEPEGGTRSVEPGGDGYEYPCWVCSENVYKNPVTQQQFQVKLVTNDPTEHQILQNQLLIAARAELLGDDEWLASLDDDHNPNEQSSSTEHTANLSGQTQAIDSYAYINLGATGLEKNKHYKIFFMFVSGEVEPSETDDTQGIPRQWHPESFLYGTTSYTFLPDSRTIKLSLAIESLGGGNTTEARLTWDGGSDPKDDKYLPLSLIAKISLEGESTKKNELGEKVAVAFTVHVLAAKQAKTRIWGTYKA